ncbi:MAG: hypothetical protein M3256_20040 [Actinomycetota bacterium]|nr:hypothetical protein [Actinomycetota bacterium]
MGTHPSEIPYPHRTSAARFADLWSDFFARGLPELPDGLQFEFARATYESAIHGLIDRQPVDWTINLTDYDEDQHSERPTEPNGICPSGQPTVCVRPIDEITASCHPTAHLAAATVDHVWVGITLG